MSRRILLADDSVTIQKVIELTFMDENYEVTAVSNGDEATSLLGELAPDVVIADVHMPGANGYEVCRRAKQLDPERPVLLLVGTFEPFDEAQSRAAGANAFLKKPFDSQELLHLVGNLLRSSAAAPEPAAPEALSAIPEPAAWERSAPAPAGFEPAEPVWSNLEVEAEPASPWQRPVAADWASPADEPVFDLEPAEDELTLEDSLLGQERSFGAAAQRDEDLPLGFELGGAPEQLPASPETATPFAASGEERLGVPLGAGPFVDDLSEVTEVAAQVEAHESAPAFAAAAAAPSLGAAAGASGRLSDEDVDRIARRLVELVGDKAVRDVAWEVVPDMAELVIKSRLRELEGQIE